MAFASDLGGIQLIDDANWRNFAKPVSGPDSGNYIPRDWAAQPLGSVPGTSPFPKELLLPRVEWKERIEEKQRTGTRLSDLCKASPVKWLIQKSPWIHTNYCFPAGTLVRMADGSHKPIEKINVLDEVLSAEGRVKRVSQVMARHVTEPLLKLVCWGHSHLRATGGHPVLTQRGYVRLADIQPGDKVAFPKYAPNSTSVLQTGEVLYEQNTVRQSRRQYRTYVKSFASGSGDDGRSIGRGSVVPDLIQLTYGFGRIIGFFLAEGHTTPYSVFWSFNIDEWDTYAAEVVALMESELGAGVKLRRVGNVAQVSFGGREWSSLFDVLCGHGSGNKRLHSSLCGGPTEFLRGVLSAWMDGDRSLGNSAVTVSRALALNMFDIANAANLLPILSTHTKDSVSPEGIIRRQAWVVAWGEGEHLNHGLEQSDTHMWRTVRGVEAEPFSGHVFNLEVDDDHSYVAEGVGVHNCWCYAVVHAVMIERVKQNQPPIRLSPTSAAAPIKNYRNEGGWGTQALEWIAKYGVASEEFWPQNRIDRQYFESSREDSLKHRIEEWFDLRDRNFDEKASCLLQNIPVPSGYDWMGHEMCSCDLVVLKNGGFGCIDLNSYSEDGSFDAYALTESRGTASDQCAPRFTTPS